MKYDFKDGRLVFIPEHDGDVFNLGKISVHFARGTEWKNESDRAVLKSLSIHPSDLYVVMNVLFGNREHHFVRRDR